MSHDAHEMLAIDALLPRYQSMGYVQAENVDIPELPKEFRGYQPDLILAKNGKFLAVELKSRRINSVHRRLEELKAAFELDPNWKFELIYLDDKLNQIQILQQPTSKILDALTNIETAVKGGHIESSFLLGWATFEAAARNTHSRTFAKPQSPGRLATVLAERGEIDPDEASKLRELVSKRNSLIHGGLDTDISVADVVALTNIIRKLVRSN